MNKKVIIILACFLVVILVGGGFWLTNSNKQTNNEISKTNENNTKQNIENENEKVLNDNNNEVQNNISNDNKMLVAYFSLPETTGEAKEDSTITVNGEAIGNTQYVAHLIKEHTGADIFRIEPVKQYNISNHQELIDDAKEEQNNNDRPEVKNKIRNFEDYDIIFIGYPIWWSDLPQILYTFLESYDFTGKTVIPFSTHGGSGLSGTVSTIKNKLNNVKVEENAFTLYRNEMEKAPKEVESWLKEIEIID